MIQLSISELLLRDISKIQEELQQYRDEADIWKAPEGISNSAGNLALHVAGNLQHFIGAVLGGSEYVRQRELEFSSKNVSTKEILRELDKAKEAVSKTMEKLPDAALTEPFPIVVFREGMTTATFLIHLVSHTDYHLGQINYHRRLLAA